MKKRLMMALAAALVLLGAGAAIYHQSYPVEADNSNLAELTTAFLNRGCDTPYVQTLQLHDWVDAGDRRFVLMELNTDDLGEIELIRGLNGRYKIGSVSWGDGNFREGVSEDGERKFYRFGGRNIGLLLDRVVVSLDDQQYTLDIPEQERFFLCVEVAPATEDWHTDLDQTHFYTVGGTEITDPNLWNGGPLSVNGG